MHRRRSLLVAAMLLAVTAAPMPTMAARDGLRAVKAATALYHSFDQAVAAGYSVEGEPCVVSPAGTMGLHAVNRALTGDLAIDALQPEILLYIPNSDGKLVLTGVEYFEVALANSDNGPIPWFGAGPPEAGFFNPAPSVLGHTFDGPMPGHNPFMPWHYDLHVWLWADNPDGMFEAWNPSLACPA